MARLLLFALAARGQSEDDSMAFIQTASKSYTFTAPEELDEPETLFHRYDEDKSGSLTLTELTTFLKSTWMPAVTPPQVRKIMRKSDADTDFALNITEFIGCASEPAACDMEVPESVLALRESKAAAAVDVLPTLGGKPDVPLSDFVSEETAASPKSVQVERCTASDRQVLKTQGMDLKGEATTPVDGLHFQTVQIRGATVKTLLLPQQCMGSLRHMGRIDKTAHAQCLQDALRITLPCARCNTDFLHSVVHACASACTPSMNSAACVACSKPLKLLECVEGKSRFNELGLTEQDIVAEAAPEGVEVLGGDTATGELILKAKVSEEAEAPPAEPEAADVEEELPAEPVADEEEEVPMDAGGDDA